MWNQVWLSKDKIYALHYSSSSVYMYIYSRSFSDGDGVCSAEVFSTNVLVNTNAGNHDHGSSKVKLKNLVDYNWEPKFYSGQLLAIHTSGKYLAYCIKGMILHFF